MDSQADTEHEVNAALCKELRLSDHRDLIDGQNGKILPSHREASKTKQACDLSKTYCGGRHRRVISLS